MVLLSPKFPSVSESNPAIEIRLRGMPAPQGSKTMTRWGMKEASNKVGPWRQTASAQAALQYKGPVIENPVQVKIIFIMPRPKHHWSTCKGEPINRLKPASPPDDHCTSGGDIDKLTRAVLDSLAVRSGGCVLRDDSRVVKLRVDKRYAEFDEPSGALIRIEYI
nr:Holliday junction resolvase (Rus) [uncultured Mediterranean phage uvMED]